MFAKIKAFFAKVFKSTTWIQVASGTLTVVAPLVETILALLAAPLEPEAATIFSEIQADLGAASVLITTAGTGGTATLTSVLDSVKTNLALLVPAMKIKDEATAAKVTAVVNTVIGEVEAIIQAVPKTA
jgi:hypothetical protein